MRQSLLAGVLEVAANNLRHTDDVRFFEIGFIYVPSRPEAAGRAAPSGTCALPAIAAREFWNDPAPAKEQAKTPLDFFDLKGVIEDLVNDLHCRMCNIVQRRPRICIRAGPPA